MPRSKDPRRPFRRVLALTDRVLALTDRAHALIERPRRQWMRRSGRSPLLLAPCGPPDACFGSLSEAERLRLARVAIERDARDVMSESD
jgi:hypothetical protein